MQSRLSRCHGYSKQEMPGAGRAAGSPQSVGSRRQTGKLFLNFFSLQHRLPICSSLQGLQRLLDKKVLCPKQSLKSKVDTGLPPGFNAQNTFSTKTSIFSNFNRQVAADALFFSASVGLSSFSPLVPLHCSCLTVRNGRPNVPPLILISSAKVLCRLPLTAIENAGL